MSNFEYTSFSSSSTGDAADGSDAAALMYNQLDANQDGFIDRNEFQQWMDRGSGGANAQNLAGAYGTGAGFESSSYQSNYSSTGDAGVASYGTDLGLTGAIGGSAYESSNFLSDGGLDARAANGTNFSSSSAPSLGSIAIGSGYDSTAINQAASYTAETNAAWSKYGAEVRGAGLYYDANPQIIHRPAAGGVQTYTQRIRIRFLQPPPAPTPGPLIIKEVRPPQPPPPPPLHIKQQAPPLPQPPPLVLREHPPRPPSPQTPKTVIRHLPALPVPPRSVIIERIPAAPSRPREIIIERWLPYGSAAKRKTIVQRAEGAKEYHKPRNIIIQYEPVQVRVVRQFQSLGIVQEDPQAYLQRYGAQLLEAQTLVQQARAAGVVEDISPPGGAAAASFRSSSFSQESSFGTSGVGGVELARATGGGELGGALSSSFSLNSLESSQIDGTGGLVGGGFESSLAEGTGASGGYGQSTFDSSSYSSGTTRAVSGFGVDTTGTDGLYNTSSYKSSNFTSGGTDGAAGIDLVASAFHNADKNKDGFLDLNEFRQFYQSGL